MNQPPPAPSNGLGVAGFVTSLVGLVMCAGIICPIGLVLSTIAMFRRPRGLAIAGFIIGLIGSSWIILVLLFFLVMGVGLAGVAAMGAGGIEAGIDATKIHRAMRTHYAANGQIPSTLALLSLDEETLTDPWGRPYRYTIEPDGKRYAIATAGPDGVWDTDDDFTFDNDASAP
ncbi:MAG: type II secretion system protein GspG [Phycisphaerales bacterium JB059]